MINIKMSYFTGTEIDIHIVTAAVTTSSTGTNFVTNPSPSTTLNDNIEIEKCNKYIFHA